VRQEKGAENCLRRGMLEVSINQRENRVGWGNGQMGRDGTLYANMSFC